MKKLYRSRRDSKLFGLCGGLAEYMNVDPTLFRLVVVGTTFFSGGTVIPIYILASIVIPKEPILDYPPHIPPYGGAYGFKPGGNGSAYGADPYHAGQQNTSYPGAAAHYTAPKSESPAPIDEMMKDIEKKALRKEIEELRAKVAQYEKGDK